jgi:hypothetical protein
MWDHLISMGSLYKHFITIYHSGMTLYKCGIFLHHSGNFINVGWLQTHWGFLYINVESMGFWWWWHRHRHSVTHTNICACTQAHARTYAHAHTHTHAVTHTHTHSHLKLGKFVLESWAAKCTRRAAPFKCLIYGIIGQSYLYRGSIKSVQTSFG